MENKIAQKITLTLVMSLFLSVAFINQPLNWGTNADLANVQIHDGVKDVPTHQMNLNCSVYPNPANEYVNLSFSLPENDELTLSITDVIGKNTKLIYTGTYNKGENIVKIETAHLTSGTYFVTVTGTKVRGNIKLILTH
jgi:hypothetical protein